MSDTSKPRDILADILNDPHTGKIRGMDELSKLICAPKQPVVGAVKTATTGGAPKKKVSRDRKHKTTHYLTTEIFETLGEAKEDIKGFLPAEARGKATKSRIVESAIAMVLKEFEKKGKDSILIQELMKKEGSNK